MILIFFTLIIIALIFAPLGCIVLWKKYVSFGDGLSHASLLAGIISIISNLPIIFFGVLISIIFAILISYLKDNINKNASISMISNLMLSIGLLISYLNPSAINIESFLFGDILSVNKLDLFTLIGIAVIVLSLVTLLYDKIILIILNKDIARIRGIKVYKIELLFLSLLAVSIFSAIKIVGTLLVTSILIIPAMSARIIASNPFNMIIYSILIAISSNVISFYISFNFDLPLTPIIVITNIAFFITFFVKKHLLN